MRKKMLKILVLLFILLLAAGAAFAHEDKGKKDDAASTVHHHEESGDRQIPEQVTSDHWAYKELSELGEKYEAEKKLPEGTSCSKSELAHCLVAILEKVVEKYDKEGPHAILRDDVERIAVLHKALEGELAKIDGYRTRRKTIEEILVLIEPEAPPFEYKVGVNGFLRGERVDSFRLPDFSFTPGHGEGRFLYRIKPYAYWHPADYLNIHLEGQGYGFLGGSQRHNKFSLYQGFVEANLPGKDWLALKAGRQEFSYGSTFILGSDSFYDGLSFDAFRLRVQPLEPLTVDLLGGRYATPFSDGLKGSLAGGYLTYAPSEDSAIEAYVFRDTGSPDRHSGEHLNIWGLRSMTKLGPLTLEFEPVYESGKVINPTTGANDSISAFGGHIDLTGEAEIGRFKNKFFLSYAIGSGSKDAANGITSKKEFRNPNNDTSLVGDMNVVGDLSGVNVGDHHASGMQIYTFGWGIDITERLNFSATGHKFVANNVESGFSRDVGWEADFNLTYAINKDISVILAYDRFLTGKFFRDASGSGRDISYAYAMVVFNFDKTKRKTLKK